MVESLEMYILIFFTYSFLGWLMESVGSIFKEKKFVNRGFLIGPYCPVYGTGVVLITFLLSKYKNDVPALFVLSTCICGVLEYLTSYFMEKLFNARWWDYSSRKFNINGRICLETLLPFGIGGTTIICLVNPFLVGIYSNLSIEVQKWIAYTLLTIYIIDSIISFVIILSFRKETFKDRDNTEEISNKVKDKTEDILMKASSDVIVFTRKVKLKELKMQRKVHYTGKKVYSIIKTTPKELSQKIVESKNEMDEKIKLAKDRIEQKQKESKENFEQRVQTIKLSSEEFTKKVRESFKNKSLLKGRLVDAFPNLKIMDKRKNNKK